MSDPRAETISYLLIAAAITGAPFFISEADEVLALPVDAEGDVMARTAGGLGRLVRVGIDQLLRAKVSAPSRIRPRVVTI